MNRGRIGRIAFYGLMSSLAVLHVLSAFTLEINADEFALLERADRTARTGELIGGGRPGLGVLLLVPFVRGCVTSVAALVEARILWLGFVGLAIVAFWKLLERALPRSRWRWTAVATGVALWTLPYLFLRHATEVRTDQPAIALTLLAGLALRASRRRPVWALVAGAVLAVGFLFSQKAIYVAGPALLLGLWPQLRRWRVRWRRDATRLLGFGFGFVALVAVFDVAVRLSGARPSTLPVGSATSTFAFYAEQIGFGYYQAVLPFLLPHILMLIGFLAGCALWVKDRRHGATTLLGVAALAMGGFLVWFHASRFTYFWLVLGIFVAVVGAAATQILFERAHGRRISALLLGIVWLLLAASGVLSSASLLDDTQARQRDGLAFVDRNFPPQARGFDHLGVFACRGDPDRFPARLMETTHAYFGGADGRRRGAELIGEFRSRPVSFMIPPFPDLPYPPQVWEFWATHYVPYRGGIWIPGRRIDGVERELVFEAVVDGEYAWYPDDRSSGLRVGSDRVEAGRGVALAAGETVRLLIEDGASGVFALEVHDPPSAARDWFTVIPPGSEFLPPEGWPGS